MIEINRRKFLAAAMQTAGTAAALGAFPPSIAKALSIPAHNRTGTIEDVEHVVILMQENRSFDHYFGTLNGVRGFGDRFTIPQPNDKPVWQQSNGARSVLPYHLDSTLGNAQRVIGTPHSWSNAQSAWDNGRMQEWPRYKNDNSMGYYTEAELQFQFALADAFTICDAYHCSLQGGTNPNRLFLWTGCNGPGGANVAAVVNEWDDFGPASEGYEWKTYPERLQAAGVSWQVFQNLPDNFTDNSLIGFKQYRSAAYRALTTLPNSDPLQPFSPAMAAISPLLKGIANTMPDGGFLQTFKNAVLTGTLPQVSWIVAPETYSEHPGPSIPIQGAWYVQEVLNALTADPEVWSKTVLIVNFDENDGFFDHVPPPAVPARNSDGSYAGLSTCDTRLEYFTHANPPGSNGQPQPDGRPYGMGARVPMWVISPWSRGGWVNSQVFDHTSVIRFLEQRFSVREPNISAWRRAVAGDLTSTLNFRTPNDDAMAELPALNKIEADAMRAAQEQLAQVAVPLETQQQLPRQARGIRPARALPYELQVFGAAQRDAAMELHFFNSGRAGVVFHVYDRLHLERNPRRYTVEAGKHLRDRWDTRSDNGAYDLWVLGPNGFHRHLRGSIEAQIKSHNFLTEHKLSTNVLPEVGLHYETDEHTLKFILINASAATINFKIVANAYDVASTHNAKANRTLRLPAGGIEQQRFYIGAQHDWYDFSITVSELPNYLRRCAGRMETGRHGISDPALGV